MGKSIRSKPNLRAKSIKRKGEFAKAVGDRNERIAKRMQDNLEKQKAEEMDTAVETETIAEPVVEKKKISTSGSRNSSRQRMKAKHTKKSKKTSVTKF